MLNTFDSCWVEYKWICHECGKVYNKEYKVHSDEVIPNAVGTPDDFFTVVEGRGITNYCLDCWIKLGEI